MEAAGIIGEAGESTVGLLPSGVRYTKSVTIGAESSANFNIQCGLLSFRSSYHSGDTSLYYVSGNSILPLAEPYNYRIAFEMSFSNGIFTVKNNSNAAKSVNVVFLNFYR